jgi:hypothetical protein
LLELFLVNTKQADPAHVNLWDWWTATRISFRRTSRA